MRTTRRVLIWSLVLASAGAVAVAAVSAWAPLVFDWHLRRLEAWNGGSYVRRSIRHELDEEALQLEGWFVKRGKPVLLRLRAELRRSSPMRKAVVLELISKVFEVNLADFWTAFADDTAAARLKSLPPNLCFEQRWDDAHGGVRSIVTLARPWREKSQVVALASDPGDRARIDVYCAPYEGYEGRCREFLAELVPRILTLRQLPDLGIPKYAEMRLYLLDSEGRVPVPGVSSAVIQPCGWAWLEYIVDVFSVTKSDGCDTGVLAMGVHQTHLSPFQAADYLAEILAIPISGAAEHAAFGFRSYDGPADDRAAVRERLARLAARDSENGFWAAVALAFLGQPDPLRERIARQAAGDAGVRERLDARLAFLDDEERERVFPGIQKLLAPPGEN